MTGKERREKGLLFIADDQDWVEMKNARRQLQKLNNMDRSDFSGINTLVRELFGKADESTFLNPPFFCDYGSNIFVGKNCFINYNCTILDNGKVRMGDNCMLAPNVSIYTAGHTLYPDSRNLGYEYGIDVTIGNNVWIGGNTVILPGINIGDNVVIGAGSVVTKDIPAWSFAAGNPCKVIRKITEEDKEFYYKQRKIDEEILKEIYHE
jgi:maltose O-acetyltransferase